jgi:hypothetical protein
MNILLDYFPIPGFALLGLAFWWVAMSRDGHEDDRRARLDDLRDGAEESYFEERRALAAYHMLPPLAYWLIGALALAYSAYLAFD